MARPEIKYAEFEHERRFLVRNPPDLSNCPFADIEDRYLEAGRLRLRKVNHNDGRIQYKFCKKYESVTHRAIPIVNIYLAEDEHSALAQLPAHPLSKRRHFLELEEGRFGIDQFKGPLEGLWLAETERASETALNSIEIPEWIAAEVTDRTEFQGAHLAKITASDLQLLLTNNS